jgi:hypothetical protein
VTPAERAYRDAWLSEMWKPVYEFREHEPQVVRRQQPSPSKPHEEKLECPFCQQVYGIRGLPKHLARVHAAEYEEVA